MKKIQCFKSCPKTKMLKKSKYCEKYAFFNGSEIVYSCDNNIKNESQKTKNFFNCNNFNYDIKEACYSCPLDCKKNKSRVKKIKDYEKQKAEKMLESYRGMTGINDYIIDNAKESLDGNLTEESKTVINQVSAANKILEDAFSGKKINIPMLYKFIKSMKYKD